MNPPPTRRARGLALAVLCAMQLMIILDGSVVTVALPTIQRELGFSPAGLAWVMNTYLVGFAGLLLLAGRLGDLVGRTRVFLVGLATFTAASLVCGVADSPALLLGGRFGQGVGGALASAVVLSMIVGLYPEPGEQAKAMGSYSFVSASGASIGLIAGGSITQLAGWHWAFLINVPIGLLAIALAGRLLPRGAGTGLGQGADYLGAALVTAGLSLGIFAIVRTAEPDAGAGQTVGAGAVAVALLAAFVVRQARAAHPLLALRIFRSRLVSAANLVTVLLVAAGFGFQFLTAIYLQRVLGYNSLSTGLAFLPTPVVIGAVSLLLSARLTARFGGRTVLRAGLVLVAAGLALLGRAPLVAGYLVDVAPALALVGVGMGLAIPTVIMLAMSGADPDQAGLASGLNNTAQQLGGAIGTATLATLAAARAAGSLARGAPAAAAVRDGYSLGMLAAAGLLLLGVALTGALPAARRRTAAPYKTPPPARPDTEVKLCEQNEGRKAPHKPSPHSTDRARSVLWVHGLRRGRTSRGSRAGAHSGTGDGAWTLSSIRSVGSAPGSRRRPGRSPPACGSCRRTARTGAARFRLPVRTAWPVPTAVGPAAA